MRKWMKRIPLQSEPLRGHVQKSRIKMRVMPDEDGAVALVGFHCLPDNGKQLSQSDVFGNGSAKWILRINAREFEGRRIEVGPLKRFDIATMSLVDHQLPLIRHLQHRDGDLQDRVGLTVKTAGLYVDYDREKPAETISNRWRVRGRHQDASATVQPTLSPARIGINTSVPS